MLVVSQQNTWDTAVMKRFANLTLAALLVAGAALAADTPKEDMNKAGSAIKKAGHHTKAAAVDTGEAAKQTAEGTGKAVKKGAKKTAHATKKGVHKAADATADATK